MARAYFVSDLHLHSSDEPRAGLFARFLRDRLNEVRLGQSVRLFLVGDIFDLWVGGHSYFQESFAEIVSLLRELIQNGVEVSYFEGNHDLHLTQFWQNQLGARVYKDAGDFEIEGLRVRVEHGDLINPDDRGYLALRWFLRTKPLEYLALNLPAALVRAIGQRASSASRHYSGLDGRDKAHETEIRALTRKHAEKRFYENPFDLMITGHVHVVDDFQFVVEGRKVRSVNLGSWFDQPRAFVIEKEKAEFIELSLG